MFDNDINNATLNVQSNVEWTEVENFDVDFVPITTKAFNVPAEDMYDRIAGSDYRDKFNFISYS